MAQQDKTSAEPKRDEKAKSLQQARADAEQPAGEFEITHDSAEPARATPKR